MLVENYYTILSRQDEPAGTLFRVRLNADSPVYKGHFPEEPVSPGVCNIQMIRELAEAVLGRAIRLTAVNQCRLTTLITPLQFPEVDVRVAIDGQKLVASIETEGQAHLTLKGEFEVV